MAWAHLCISCLVHSHQAHISCCLIHLCMAMRLLVQCLTPTISNINHSRTIMHPLNQTVRRMGWSCLFCPLLRPQRSRSMRHNAMHTRSLECRPALQQRLSSRGMSSWQSSAACWVNAFDGLQLELDKMVAASCGSHARMSSAEADSVEVGEFSPSIAELRSPA